MQMSFLIVKNSDFNWEAAIFFSSPLV